MRRDQLKKIQEISKPEDLPIEEEKLSEDSNRYLEVGEAVKAELIPSFDPNNRQDYINKMAEKVLSGELTYYDVGRELQLTKSQIEFCKYFADTKSETGANGTKSAMLAYDYDYNNKGQLQAARNYACNYTKPSHPCSTLIQILINGDGVNAHNVDMNLNYIANQKFDLKAAVLANRELNTVLGRNNTKKVEVTVTHKLDTSNLPKKERLKLIETMRKCQIKDDENT